MTTSDFERFGRALRAVAEGIGEAITTERVMLYFKRLDRFDIDTVERALGQGQDRWKFFPKIPEILEAIEGSPDDRALTAWTRVENALERVGSYQSVTFDDPILHATICQMGGWATAWEWERLDERDYGFKRLEFTRLYGHFLRVGVPRPIAYLPGQHESENRATPAMWKHGLDHADEIHRIGTSGAPVGILPRDDRRALQGDMRPLALSSAVHDPGRHHDTGKDKTDG